MQKIKKYLLCLIACCLAFVCAFGAACSEGGSDGDGGSGSENSEEENTENNSNTSGSENNDNNEEEEENYTLSSTNVYFVGDSTVCEFSDAYYLPRYGYGTQFKNYIDTSYVKVTNLALSGRSSKSFISESNYTTLTSSLGEGDYLIIGFGHNDEKSDDSTRYTTPETDAVNTEGSFQYYLYKYYVEMAINRGATPILCTPIVRYNSSNNYEGSSGHVTSDGDYAACILDLAEDYNITCVDLTSITKTLYTNLQEEAKWFHAHTVGIISDDASAREVENSKTGETVKVVPSGMDSTHINMYGAKMVAYQLASALRTARKTCNLGYYVLSDITEPNEDDLEAAFNSQYKYKPYDAFNATTDKSNNWTLSSDGWYGTVFGDTSTDSFASNGYVISETTAGTITVGQSLSGSNKGKIGSTEGIAMAFTQLAYNQNFTMTVSAKVTTANSSTTADTAAVSQSGFGLMLRDDIYIDAAKDTSILSNYVASGMYVTGSDTLTSNIIYVREETKLSNSGNKVSSAYKVGDTATLTIVRTGQNITCTVIYGGETYSYTYYDFDLVAVDGDYMYLGFYATRGTVVEFSNFTYTATGTAADA